MSFKFNPFTGNLDNTAKDNSAITKEPTGFDDPSAVTVSYDNTTRKITLTGTFKAYWRGVEVSVLTNGWISDAHDDITGAWFLYYNGTAFVWSQTAWTFDKLQIAYVYNDGINFGLRECHGLMQHQVHQELHNTVGTYKSSGADFSSYVLNSTTAGDRKPTVSSTIIYDEDLISTLPILNNDTYTTAWLTSTGIASFNTTATDIVPLNGNQPYWNQYTGGSWTQTLLNTSEYMCVWLVAMPVTTDTDSQKFRYLWVQGQSAGNLASQQARTPNDVNKGNFSVLSPEFVFTTKIIIHYIGGNWSLYSVENITGTKLAQTTTTGTFLSSVVTDATLTGDGTASNPLSVVGSGPITWTELVNRWTEEPTSETYTGGDGEVFKYTYGTTLYYRFVPSTYDSTQDAFYTTFSNPTLSGLVARRGNSI